MNKYVVLLIEAIFIGIITVIVGQLVSNAFGVVLKNSDLPEECKSWNKNYVMEKSLFLTGFMTHLLCQAFGINGWYCKHGIACIAN